MSPSAIGSMPSRASSGSSTATFVGSNTTTSPNVRGSTNISSLPSSRCITTWVCGGREARPAATSNLPVIRRWIIISSPVSSGRQEVLPTPVGSDDRGSRQSVDDRLCRRAPHRSEPADLDPFDPPADGEAGEAPPDGLDLWQFGHASFRIRIGQAGIQTAVKRRRARRSASEAAICSAAFFERPSPSPMMRPSSTTVAKNLLA